MTTESTVDLFPLSSEDDADRVVAFYSRAYNEMLPRSQGTAVDEFRARFADPALEMHTFAIEDGSGGIEGVGIGIHWMDGTNGHLQWAQILVRPESRRMGHGRRLLARLAAVAASCGRSVMLADAYDTVPAGGAFAQAVGAHAAMREHISVVETDALDRTMLEAWRQDEPIRAEGYEVLSWADGWEQEHDSAIARLFVMADEDMPFEDAAFDPGAETAGTVRARLERTKDTITRVTSVVRHAESRVLVGFSELIVKASDSNTLFTMLTVVDRDHRGHGLGKWVKADSILHGIERWPRATHIQTENAASNAPMLGINDAIGFAPEHRMITYQATVDRVREYLERA